MTFTTLKYLMLAAFIVAGSNGYVQGQKKVTSFEQPVKIPQVIKIYPNPAIDHFTLQIDQDISTISIFNILGKEVSKFKTTQDHVYPVGDLKRGIYIVRVFDSNDRLLKALRLSKA